MVNIKEQVVVM